MTFEQLIATIREWQNRMTPEQARQATEDWARGATIAIAGCLLRAAIDVDAFAGWPSQANSSEISTGYFRGSL